MTQKRQVVKFDNCGLYRLLYMVEDTGVLQEIETECLAALEEYDRKYNAGYVETLQSYLKHNGSIQAVAEELYTHRKMCIRDRSKGRETSFLSVAGWNYDAAGNGYKGDIRKRPDRNRSAGRHCKPGRNRITCRPAGCLLPVSYTHLDVYKRQDLDRLVCPVSRGFFCFRTMLYIL